MTKGLCYFKGWKKLLSAKMIMKSFVEAVSM